MDAVKSFNAELSSLYDVKPPISKAKMSALTRGAIKAIKFYKHVVQSVEKFIQKCKAEYKVPGLYVIDSIVRQSRHQFGIEKDVFAPRFTKNIQQTFVNLFKCPPEDKSKIIRVLNLWLKNQVFPNEVISPLFDLADPNNPIHKEVEASQAAQQAQQTNGVNNTSVPVAVKGSPALQKTPTKTNQPNEAQHGSTPNLNIAEPVIQQLQQLQRLLTKSSDASRPTDAQVHFDKKLLDYDYGDDEDEVNPSPRPPPQNMADPVATVTNILTNPEILRQLQTLQTTLTGVSQQQQPQEDPDKMKKLQEMRMQEEEFDRHLAQTVPNLPFASECEFRLNSATSTAAQFFNPPPPEDNGQPVYSKPLEFDLTQDYSNVENRPQDIEVIMLDHEDSRSDEERRSSRGRRRSRSRSRDRARNDRDKRSKRSRSRSKSRRHRSRTRSRDRKKKDDKEKERDLEKEKERKRRGLPAIKRDCLSVCSTTLWVGHLSKLVHQDDLSNTFGEYGEIVSIDLISPRGCAFIVMNRRQDAARCLTKLKNYNLNGKAITLAWAPGKGVKGKDFKDYWEGDLGVSYIPYSKIKQDIDLELLEDGGTIDEDTMPQWMKDKLERVHPKPFLMGDASNQSGIDTTQPPPMPAGGLLQPPMMPPVSPFMFSNRLMGMMPPNMTMGVPPPNMPPPMMPPQSILGLAGSPFQGGPGMMPPRMPGLENKINPPTSLSDTLMTLAQNPLGSLGLQPPLPSGIPPTNQPPPPFGGQQEEMDIEMEDVDHRQNLSLPPPSQIPEKYISLSEQLAASMNQQRDRDNRRDDREDRRGDRRDDGAGRGRKRSRSRDRDRDRDRVGRDRTARGGSRDRDRRDRDRGERDFRGRDRRDNNKDRDNSNRWGGDRRDQNPVDRKEREKTLNDRLREMAGMPPEENKQGGRSDKSRERERDRRGSRSSDRKSRDRNSSRDNREREKPSRFGHVEDEDLRQPHKDENEEQKPKEQVKPDQKSEDNQIAEKPPSLMNINTQEAIEMDNPLEGPPLSFEPPSNFDRPLLDNFGRPKEEHPIDFAPVDFAGPPGFDGPPDGMGLPVEFGRPNRNFNDGPVFDGPPDRFSRPRGRGGRFNRRGGFDGPPRGFDGPPRDFDGPPRDFNGPPRDFDGPPRDFDGPPRNFNGPPRDFEGPPRDFDGPPRNFDGPPFDGPPPFERPPFNGPPYEGPPMEFDGPPGRFGRGGRNRRGRGRDDFFPPSDDFGPRLLGMEGPEFGHRGNRGGTFFAPRGPRGGRGGIQSRYDGPPDFFRGGGSARGNTRPPFDNFRGGRGRGRGRGNRFDGPAFDGPPFDGPPFDGPPFDGPRFDGPPFDGPPFDGPPSFDRPPFDGPPFGRPPFDRPPFDGPPGSERGPLFVDEGDRPRRDGRRSRWGGEDFNEEPHQANAEEPPAEGNSTPLRDEAPNHDAEASQRDHNEPSQSFDALQGPPESSQNAPNELQGPPEHFDEPQGPSEDSAQFEKPLEVEGNVPSAAQDSADGSAPPSE